MKLKRTYIWFHHIYNAKKKQNIAALGSKLDITGFCYTGKPGVIVIEGSQSDNKQFISTLRRWPWQKMTVRAIEDEEEADQGRRFDKFHMTGAPGGKKSDTGEIKQILEDASLEHHFDALMGYDWLNQD